MKTEPADSGRKISSPQSKVSVPQGRTEPRYFNEVAENASVPVRSSERFEPDSERFPALEEEEFVLTHFAPDAKEVKVAGNFNGWNPNATPLINTGSGEWMVRLSLRAGQYEYRFIVDGEWAEDPRAAHRVPNGFGEFNSVLTVPLAVRTSLL